MSNLFDSFDKFSGSKNKWIQVQSELEGLSGDKEEIKIEPKRVVKFCNFTFIIWFT